MPISVSEPPAITVKAALTSGVKPKRSSPQT